jgi:TPR repeat protein
MRKRLISTVLAFLLLPACGSAQASDNLMTDLERLASQNNAEAIYHIVTAVAWLDKAASQGWPDALATYASIYNGAAGVTPDPVKTAAYFQLFLDRTDASEEQQKWLDTFKQRMTPEQRQLALNIVHKYRAHPTPLTIRALSGQRAAAQLVASKG